MSNLKRQLDISVYINKHVIEALTMINSSVRDYKLGGLGLAFEIDQRLQDCFKQRINEAKLKTLIQKKFNGPLHDFDDCTMGYFKISELPVCWHITTINRKSGKPEKFRYLRQCGKHLSYKMTVYRAYDFARLNPTGEINE